MKISRIISVVLSCVMLLTVLAACGGSEPVVERGAAADIAAADADAATNVDDGAVDIYEETPPAGGFAGMMPDRVSVLDHSALDIVNALGFGNHVVSVIGGRSASDALYLQDFYDSDRVNVLEVHGGGGTGTPVVSAGGGIFASAMMTIENSLVIANTNGDEPCDVDRARAGFDRGNNRFGTAQGNDGEAFVLAGSSEIDVTMDTIIEDLTASIGTPPVFTQTPGSGATSWVDFTAAVGAAASGETVEIGADLAMTSVLIIDSDVTIEGNGFTLTKTESIVGAPIVIEGGTDVNVTINNTVFDGDNFDEAHDDPLFDGGLIRARGNLTITNSLFKNGFSRMITGGVGTGGAISSSDGTLTVTDSFFYNNFGSRQGGAIRSTGALYVTRCVFVGNREERSGGGAISASGVTEVRDSVFFQNYSLLGSISSGSQGGAIHASGNNSFAIINSSIVGNAAGVMPGTDGRVVTNIDRFFTIDADLIIGGPGQAHLYDDVFSVIAPTMIIESLRTHEGGTLAGVIEATRLIASIWNAEEAGEALIADLTARYETVSDEVGYNKGIAVTLNAANGGFILAAESAFEQSLLYEMGFTHFDRSLIPAHFQDVNAMTEYAAAQTEVEMNTRDVMMLFLEWADNEPEIGYIIVFDNTFDSIDAAEAAPAASGGGGGGGAPAEPTDYSGIRAMQTYQEGRLAIFSNTSNTLGLTRLDMQLQTLANIFIQG